MNQVKTFFVHTLSHKTEYYNKEQVVDTVIMDVLKEDKGMMTKGTGDQNGVDLSSILLEPRTHSLDYNSNNNNSMIQDGEVAKGVQVSHVPVSDSDRSVYTLPSDSSTNTLSSSSQSTLCSLLTTSKSAADLNSTTSTGIYAHESTEIEKIRASKSNLITTPPEQKQATLSLKSMCTNETIDDDDVMKAVSNEANNKLSRRLSFESSIAPTRPSKKVRIEDNNAVSTNETTTSIPLILDAISSVGTTKVRSVSISTSVTTAPPHQDQQQHQPSSLTLLAQQDQDSNFLNPLHVFIRNQIEVFTATTTELAQPAPGRKQPIQLNQVGLRCIHCRHLPNQKRVKRATCYPTSVGRVYHSISDMKFDHFSNCKELPKEARKTFESLKTDGKRGSGHSKKDNKKSPKTSRKGHSSSTAQYYQDSASRMGMVDGPGGIIYMMSSIGGSTTGDTSTKVVAVVENKVSSVDVAETTKTEASSLVKNHAGVSSDKNLISRPPPQQQQQQQKPYQQFQIQQQDLAAANSTAVAASMLFHPIPVLNNLNNTLTTEENNEQLKNLTATMSSNIMQSLLWNAIAAGQKAIDAANAIANQQKKNLQQQYHQRQNGIGKIAVPLSAPKDSDVLSPVHCFVRKHVELFTADEHDIAAPSPGRKTRVQFRQVGIRCKHCVKFPFKERVKRAVCYPPSIDGVYHSVSNMKFDHFGICPGLPASAREEFTNIKKSCGRRGGGTNNNGGDKSTTRTAASSSTTTGTMNTAQYYHDSAIAKGLVDTDKGIRFGNDVVNHIAAAAVSAGTPNTNMITARAQALYEHSKKLPTGISALMMAASQATSI
jgi:hypothetical protein